jgi:TetR/AcrR family transcriptional regulator, mexJK operon transcriptional repressor
VTTAIAKRLDRAPPRLGRPQGADTRRKMEEVLRAARAHFARFGYRAATMDAIAAEAGVSKRTLYMWHKDKLALLTACVADGAAHFPPLPSGEGELEAELGDYAARLAGEFTSGNNPGLGMLLFREGHDAPELLAAVDRSITEQIVAPLAAYLRRRGLCDDEAARADLFVTMALGDLHRRYSFGRPTPSPEEIRRHAALAAEVFVRGALKA